MLGMLTQKAPSSARKWGESHKGESSEKEESTDKVRGNYQVDVHGSQRKGESNRHKCQLITRRAEYKRKWYDSKLGENLPKQ